jgi:glycosyltransferase involved in cell wall biosynthesis
LDNSPIIDVIIPAFNEADSIALVLKDIPKHIVRHIIVCENACTDETPDIAFNNGAIVVSQDNRGYGNACLKGLEYLDELNKKPDIVVFLDADYSDDPTEMSNLTKEIIENDFDLVIGTRVLGNLEKGAMMPQQIFGNWLATNLIRLFYGYQFTDLGPFRAIKYDKLMELDMQDKNFGWTVEMQVKAAKYKFKCTEIPVNYRKRIGFSKISGTIKGTILAGHKILWTIFKLL